MRNEVFECPRNAHNLGRRDCIAECCPRLRNRVGQFGVARPKRSAWSKDDVQVMRALDEPTELECTEMRLTDVVQYLASRHNIPIKLDEVALGRANISIESPVSMNAANITLRELLRPRLAR